MAGAESGCATVGKLGEQIAVLIREGCSFCVLD